MQPAKEKGNQQIRIWGQQAAEQPEYPFASINSWHIHSTRPPNYEIWQR